MIILTLVVTAVLAFRFWSRMEAMHSTVADLTARVRALEEPRSSIPSRASVPRVEAVVRPSAHVAPVIPPPAPPPPVTAAAVQGRLAPGDTLETRIGARWLLYAGVIAIVVGVSYFEKLAIDNHWVTETTRVLQGGVIGFALIVGGLQFVRKGYRLYGQILSGCGLAILYVSTYAAFNLYELISQAVAFGLMSAVTVLAAWLANRQRSQGLALMAVGGGFATPFLLPTTTDAEVALFGYDAILIAGTMFLARRRDWPTLNVVSYGFTVLTVCAWAAQFYTPSKYLTTHLFLTLFCGMFLYILRAAFHSQHPSAQAERAVLWTAPFGYYFSSLVVLGEHSSALLVYLVILSLVGVMVGSRAGRWIRLAFWVAVAAPLLLWSDAHGVRTWVAAGLAAWTGVYILNLAGLLEATVWKERRFRAADIALLHLNGLGAYAGAYLLIDPVRREACGPLAAALTLVNWTFCCLLAKRFREEALQFGALAFTFLTIAIALQFEGAWITMAWAAEGAVMTWLGLREQREWLRAGGLALFGVAVVRLLALQFSEPPVGQILFLNRRALSSAFIISLTYGLTFAHQRSGTSDRRRTETGVGLLLAKLLLLALAASEIVAYWMLHVPPPFEPSAQVIDASFLVGAVIIWLSLRRHEEWMRAVGSIVVALGALFLFFTQLQVAPRGYVTLLNGRAAAGLLAVLTLYGLAVIHRRTGRHVAELAANIAVLTTSASLLTLSLLTSEIDAFWAARGAAEVWSMAREGLQAIAWAGVGGFLIWHGLSNRLTWIRAIGGALLVVGVLHLLRLQFADATPSYAVIANARVMTSIVMVALLYGLATLYGNAGNVTEGRNAASTALLLVANVLTLTLLTSEITAYWHVHDVRHVSALLSADSHFAREMMLSITWAVYATLLIVVGLRRKYAPIRYFAITVFLITIVKVFAIDLAELDRLYRVLSVMGLGVTLLLTSYLYQKVSPEPSEQGAAARPLKNMTTLWKWLTVVAIGVTAMTYLVVTNVIPTIAAGALLHPSRRPVGSRPPASCTDVEFIGAGVTLKGWRCQAIGQHRATLVYLHGVGDNRESVAGAVDRFVSKGIDVVAYDSRAQGESTGDACTYGYWEKRDLKKVLDTINPGPVLLLGTSLGAAVALQEAADDSRVIGVVAAEVFSDLRTVAEERAPQFLTQGMIRRAFSIAETQGAFRFDDVSPVNSARRITIPVLLVHGTQDTDTSSDHSRRVLNALAGPKELVLVQGARHNESLRSHETWQRIDRWVDDVIGPSVEKPVDPNRDRLQPS